jgi:hypothetical protein
VRGDALPHLSSLTSAFEEVIISLHLIPRKRPLPRRTVLRTWHDLDLVLHAAVSGKRSLDLFRKYISVLASQRVQGVARGLQRLPGLGRKPLCAC